MDEKIFSRLFNYSEWLDGQGLVRDDDSTGDDRSHEQLVKDFLKGDA